MGILRRRTEFSRIGQRAIAHFEKLLQMSPGVVALPKVTCQPLRCVGGRVEQPLTGCGSEKFGRLDQHARSALS